jgi:hypothetical protein
MCTRVAQERRVRRPCVGSYIKATYPSALAAFHLAGRRETKYKIMGYQKVMWPSDLLHVNFDVYLKR